MNTESLTRTACYLACSTLLTLYVHSAALNYSLACLHTRSPAHEKVNDKMVI